MRRSDVSSLRGFYVARGRSSLHAREEIYGARVRKKTHKPGRYLNILDYLSRTVGEIVFVRKLSRSRTKNTSEKFSKFWFFINWPAQKYKKYPGFATNAGHCRGLAGRGTFDQKAGRYLEGIGRYRMGVGSQ